MNKEYTIHTRMKIARKKYGVSKVFMSRVAGFGVNTWAQYEGGKEIESLANKHIVESLITPYGYYKFLTKYYPNSLRDDHTYINAVKKATQICCGIQNYLVSEYSKIEEKINTDFSYE